MMVISFAQFFKLQVYIKNSQGEEHLKWSRSGNQGNRWYRGFVHIEYDYFQVIFEGKGSSRERDNIAIDDVRIAACETLRK